MEENDKLKKCRDGNEYREEETTHRQRRERRRGVERDMEIKGDINREKRDPGMTEADTT